MCAENVVLYNESLFFNHYDAVRECAKLKMRMCTLDETIYDELFPGRQLFSRFGNPIYDCLMHQDMRSGRLMNALFPGLKRRAGERAQTGSILLCEQRTEGHGPADERYFLLFSFIIPFIFCLFV